MLYTFYKVLHIFYHMFISATVPLGTSGVLIRPLLVTGSGDGLAGQWLWGWSADVHPADALVLRGPRVQMSHGLHAFLDFFSYFV